jgi:hypothetical protein
VRSMHPRGLNHGYHRHRESGADVIASWVMIIIIIITALMTLTWHARRVLPVPAGPVATTMYGK